MHIYISECKNWGYVEQVQRVKWYVSYEAGFIFKASWEDLCDMLDKVCCTVVKPWNLLLQMRQCCIEWSVVRYIFTTYVYIIYHIQNIFKTWSQSHMRFDTTTPGFMFWYLFNWASKPDTRTIYTVNVYTRSHIKEHKVVPECWQLSRLATPHCCLEKIYLEIVVNALIIFLCYINNLLMLLV